MIGVDWEIQNWCRWHWSGMRWRRQACGSIESRWRSPQPWDSAPVVPLGKVDQLRAQTVERVWRGLPDKAKLILKWHHVFRLAPGSILGRLYRHGIGVPRAMFPVELDSAKYALALALDGHYSVLPWPESYRFSGLALKIA